MEATLSSVEETGIKILKKEPKRMGRVTSAAGEAPGHLISKECHQCGHEKLG